MSENKNTIKSCSFCSSNKYYAKGLCKNCYARQFLKGSIEYGIVNAKHITSSIKIGDKFERLKVIEILDNYKCMCLCECGEKKVIKAPSLLTGKILSCGCLRKEVKRKYFEFEPRTSTEIQFYELYKQGMTYQKIADCFHVTRQYVGLVMKKCSKTMNRNENLPRQKNKC